MNRIKSEILCGFHSPLSKQTMLPEYNCSGSIVFSAPVKGGYELCGFIP